MSIDLDLIPLEALAEVSKVLEHGAEKHGAHDWRQGHINRSLTYQLDHISQHLDAFVASQNNEDESGLSHLAHVAARCLFIIAHQKCGTAIDDRPANTG